MNRYKNIVLGGLLAGSLIGTGTPVLAQTLEFVNDRYVSRGEVQQDRQALERDYEQLRQDKETRDRLVRHGAGPQRIARIEQKIREDEMQIRRDEAELRRDRRELAGNYWTWRERHEDWRYE
ncbi:MAG TPA: hypothetical protein VGL11_19230 [Candidatus Binatia bacterium]|jgi:hypothetical protein